MRHASINSQFPKVGIFARVKNDGVSETLYTLIEFLRQIGQPFFIDQQTSDSLQDVTLAKFAKPDLMQACDLLIVVGGDGSLLHAARTAVAANIPVLGVNRGRLGFLTDILPTEILKIKKILEGEYFSEQRFLLDGWVENAGETSTHFAALNEIALIPDCVPHMNEFEVYIDDQFLCSQASDGIIVATPTGSTAYALSGGGPILHPQLDAVVLVPSFPHTLSIRPIVIEGHHHIRIKISSQNEVTPRISFDGQDFLSTPPGSTIHIEKKAERLHLIHPTDYDYYESLRSKLHWGKKLHHTG